MKYLRISEEKEDIAQQEIELDAQIATLTDEIAELRKDKAYFYYIAICLFSLNIFIVRLIQLYYVILTVVGIDFSEIFVLT